MATSRPTAVGLMVAIPAVIGFNFFNRRVRAHMSNVDALAHEVLAELKGETDSTTKPKISEVK